MVVAGILALALALPTGALFGIGYGTGVRIGYEQIYPLLFPAKEDGTRNTASTVENVNAINKIYNAIGGKEASQMGMAVGLSNVMSELDTNPDFQALLKLESSESGATLLNSKEQTTLEKILYSLSQASPFNEPHGHTAEEHEQHPTSFLQNPIITTGFEEGPPNITDKYGYSSMTRTELLNNQPSEPRFNYSVEAIKERQVQWTHYYDIALADYLQGLASKNETYTAPTLLINKETVNQMQTDYVVKRAELLTTIHTLNSEMQSLITMKSANKQEPMATNLQNAINTKDAEKARAIKLLQNHITLARNVISTKALANNDWNARIWQV